jgi:hypothetical protein
METPAERRIWAGSDVEMLLELEAVTSKFSPRICPIRLLDTPLVPVIFKPALHFRALNNVGNLERTFGTFA